MCYSVLDTVYIFTFRSTLKVKKMWFTIGMLHQFDMSLHAPDPSLSIRPVIQCFCVTESSADRMLKLGRLPVIKKRGVLYVLLSL